MQQETNERLCKYQNIFLNLCNENPNLIIQSLSNIDILKPQIWADSRENGGKLGRRGIARKYNLTEGKVRWILKNIKKENK